jgi:alpha-glucosidase
MLQEDDGLTFFARDGACYRTTFTVTRDADRLQVHADIEGDGYPEFARQMFQLVVHGAAPSAVHLDGAEIEVSDGAFPLPNTGTAFVVEVDL